MRTASENGFSKKTVIIAGIVIAVIGFALYLGTQGTQKQSATPSPSASPVPVTDPRELTQASDNVKLFYKKVLDRKYDSKGYLIGNIYSADKWVSDGFTTEKAVAEQQYEHGFYLAWCSEDNPLKFEQYTFKDPVLTTAGGSLEIGLAGESTTYIKVHLVKDMGIWVIDSFECPGHVHDH